MGYYCRAALGLMVLLVRRVGLARGRALQEERHCCWSREPFSLLLSLDPGQGLLW